MRTVTIAAAAAIIVGAAAYKRHRDGGGLFGEPKWKPPPAPAPPKFASDEVCPPDGWAGTLCKGAITFYNLVQLIPGCKADAADLQVQYDRHNRALNGPCVAVNRYVDLRSVGKACYEAFLGTPNWGNSLADFAEKDKKGTCVMYANGCIPMRGESRWRHCKPGTLSLDSREWSKVKPEDYHGWPWWDTGEKVHANGANKCICGLLGCGKTASICKSWEALID